MCNGQTKMATSGLFRFLSDIFDELTSLKLEDFFGSSYGCYYIRIGNRHWCIRIEQRYEISSLCKIAIYDMSQVKSETPRSSSYVFIGHCWKGIINMFYAPKALLCFRQQFIFSIMITNNVGQCRHYLSTVLWEFHLGKSHGKDIT